MNGTVLLIVHGAESNPGQVGAALDAKGWKTERCCPRLGDPLPERPGDYAGVVVFGGPMSAYDDYLSFIRAELDWLPRVVDAGVPFLGICLGAQLLARALGARVAPHAEGMHEIGYYPLRPTDAGNGHFPAPMRVYHWHGDGFELPEGGVLLAEGDIFPNQAFQYGDSAFAIQFHPEMQEPILRRWMSGAAHKLAYPGAQQPAEQRAGHARHAAAMHAWLDRFLDGWLARPAPSPRRADASRVAVVDASQR